MTPGTGVVASNLLTGDSEHVNPEGLPASHVQLPYACAVFEAVIVARSCHC